MALFSSRADSGPLATTLRIAARNLLANRRRSLLTFLALFLSLWLTVAMKGFVHGLDRLLRDEVIEVQTGALQVHRAGFARAVTVSALDLDLPADEGTLGRLRALPHVRAVAARIVAGGLVNAHDRTVLATFIAVDPTAETLVCPRRFVDLAEGDGPSRSRPDGAALTRRLLAGLGAQRGERVTLIASDRDGVLSAVEVGASGTLRDPGLFSADKKLVYLPLAAAQELFRMPDRALEIGIAVDDLDRVDEVAAAVRTTLGRDFEVATFHDLTAFDREASAAREQATGLLTWLFVIVALVGITNTMLMGVRERTREIGTMMALGARRRQILALFLAEAAILGAVGGLLGVAAGLATVHLLGAHGLTLAADDGISTFVVRPFVTASWVASVFTGAVVGASAAALYPALRASRLRPIEALSHVSA